MSKIGILGSGTVGKTLGSGFLKYGDEVLIGTRDVSKLAAWASDNPGGEVGSFADAAKFGEIVVLAGKGTAAAAMLKSAGGENLGGKVVIDATNPIADAPPENGVLKYFTSLDRSLMEDLQAAYPDARFVKAFSSVGAHLMVNPSLAEKPTMFICGNDAAAKAEVTTILDRFGFETADMGSVEAARAIEPLAMLWCIPGFLENKWGHAFRVLWK